MFGYITINKPELKIREYNRYRACYCGLCRRLKEKFGLPGELTITYDMTFLILLLNSLYEPKETIRYCRCAAHPLRRHAELISEYSDYGADMNVVLTYYKLLDDGRDEGNPISMLASLTLRPQIRRIREQYPRQTAVIRRELEYLHTLEKNDIRDMERASRSFGRLLGQIFVYQKDTWSHTLYRIGYYLGIYIYLIDAWNDLPEDRRRKQYNPLPFDEHTGKREMAFRRLLTQVMAACAEQMESLPLLEDVEILRNILYSGVWTSFGKNEKKGYLKYDKGSV